MPELLTAAEMRAIEAAAIARGAATGLGLMERAGAGVVGAIRAWLTRAPAEAGDDPDPDADADPDRQQDQEPGPDRDGDRDADPAAPAGDPLARVLVLAGPGNNGGDGFVIARHLREQGAGVQVVLLGRDPEEIDRLPPDAAENARRWRAAGGAILPCPEAPERLLAAQRPGLVIDAIFGTGLVRPVGGAVADVIAALRRVPRRCRPRVVAVDVPSGLCADSGRVLGAAVRADLTVTFHAAKPGHHLADGPARCGRLETVPIGLPGSAEGAAARTRLVDLGAGAGAGGRAARRALAKRAGHKYDHGHALVLAGGVGRGGAGRLAARAALRIGAGLVTVGCPPSALIENAARLDAIMLRPVGDAAALAALLGDGRITALCLGPGLGTGERTRALVAAACAAGRGTVLDADALTSFAADPAALFALLHPAVVLTPHAGEFGRLFPDIHAGLEAAPTRGPAVSKLDAARAAAARAGCVVLLKGPDTVIADPAGRALVHSAAYGRAAPWLATAGAGDVLAGMIAGLVARGVAPLDAAGSAAWLHVEAARRFGPGLVAEDLPEMLPAVLGALGA